MKQKKVIIFIVLFVIIGIVCMLFCSRRKTTTPDKLISKLENAINKQDAELLVECFPDFMRDGISAKISQEKFEEFYNNVVADEELKFQIIEKVNMDIETVNSYIEDIKSKYGAEIDVTDYQLIQVKYHEQFETPMYEIIEIGGEYYIYSGRYYPSPIQYFFD